FNNERRLLNDLERMKGDLFEKLKNSRLKRRRYYSSLPISRKIGTLPLFQTDIKSNFDKAKELNRTEYQKSFKIIIYRPKDYCQSFLELILSQPLFMSVSQMKIRFMKHLSTREQAEPIRHLGIDLKDDDNGSILIVNSNIWN